MKRIRGSPDSQLPLVERGIIIERNRVGTAPLCRLPAVGSIPHHTDPFAATAEQIRHDAFTILDRQGVRWLTCDVVTRRWRFDTSDDVADWPLTLLVVTSPDNSGDKKAACMSLREYIRRAETGRALGVEIIDVQATEEPRSFPIEPEDPIVSRWAAVEPRIIDVLLPTDVIAFTVIRRGKKERPKDNPVTLFVSIPEESEDDWLIVREQVTDVLDEAGLIDMALELSRGTYWPQAGTDSIEPLPSDIWGAAAMAGHSFSVYDCEHSSTLGSFVDIEHTTGQWKTYAVTCHHSVFPTSKRTEWMRAMATDIQRWHQEGFKPQDSKRFSVRMVQPSQRDVQRTVQEWKSRQESHRSKSHQLKDQLARDEILSGIDARRLREAERFIQYFQSRIDRAEAFVADATPRTVDWALVEVIPSRVGKNQLPPRSDVPRIFRDDYWVPEDRLVMPGMEVLLEEQMFFKVGRTTGLTCGLYNGIREVKFTDRLRLAQGQAREPVTWDHCIVGRGHTGFAAGGDSGAFVFNWNGEVVGMMLGADGSCDFCTLMSAAALCKDILHITGARAVKLSGT